MAINRELLEQAGLSAELIVEVIKKAEKEQAEAFKMKILDTQPVKTFKGWLAKQEYPVRLTFVLPEIGKEVEIKVGKPTEGTGGTSGRRSTILVATKQGGAESFPSYAEACRKLGLGDPSEMNRSGKQMLDGAGIKYEVIREAE